MGMLKKFSSTVSGTKTPEEVRLENPNPRSVKLAPDPEPAAEPEVTTVVTPEAGGAIPNPDTSDEFSTLMSELGLDDLLEPAPEPEPAPAAVAEPEPEPAPAPAAPKQWRFQPPQIDEEALANAADLRNFAVLVTLRTSRWNAKATDRKALADVASANAAKGNFGQFQKNLLAGADEKLKAVNSAIDAARHTYYRLTLPWTLAGRDAPGRRQGSRLLPNDIFFDFTKEMAAAKTAMQVRLQEFISEYPTLVQEAEKSLGTLFNAKEYPSAHSIASHFDLSFEFAPVPQGGDFSGLPEAVLGKLAAKVNEQVMTMTQNAMDEAWTQLYDTTLHIAERLSDPDKVFHKTTFERAAELVRTLKALNITKDPNLESFRHRLETHVLCYQPKQLRDDTSMRTTAAKHARTIVSDMAKLCS